MRITYIWNFQLNLLNSTYLIYLGRMCPCFQGLMCISNFKRKNMYRGTKGQNIFHNSCLIKAMIINKTLQLSAVRLLSWILNSKHRFWLVHIFTRAQPSVWENVIFHKWDRHAFISETKLLISKWICPHSHF